MSRGVHGLASMVRRNPPAREAVSCRSATEYLAALFFFAGYLMGGDVNGIRLMRGGLACPEGGERANRPTNSTHGADSCLD